MTYKFMIDTERFMLLELPTPVEEMSKRDWNKIRKWIYKTLDSVLARNKIEARSRLLAYESEVQKLKVLLND